MRKWIIILAVILFIILLPIMSIKILKFIYPIKYQDSITKYSKIYNLDPFVVLSVIKTESNFNEKAVSSKNARGLMQISLVTGKWGAETLKIKDYSDDLLFAPDNNIRIGCWYLSQLSKQFKGDMVRVLAAYNGGSGNVNKWLNDDRYSSDGHHLDTIPFKETKNFVKKVMASHKTYLYLYKK